MSKILIKMLIVAIGVTMLAVGSVGVMAASTPAQSAPALSFATAEGAPLTLEQLHARIMEMQNRNRVTTILDRLVAESRITQDEANQILSDWDAAHPDWQPLSSPTL